MMKRSLEKSFRLAVKIGPAGNTIINTVIAFN